MGQQPSYRQTSLRHSFQQPGWRRGWSGEWEAAQGRLAILRVYSPYDEP